MTETKWRYIQSSLPTKVRGVPRVDDRRVINGIFYILRSGCAWRDLPQRYGSYTTVYNRFNRWAKAGIWDRIMDAVIDANGGDVVMIDGRTATKKFKQNLSHLIQGPYI